MDRILVFHDNIILKTLPEVCEKVGMTFTSIPNCLTPQNEWDSINCKVFGKSFFAHFDLQQMPGCCAVLVLSYVKVRPWTLDNFDALVQLVEEGAHEAGFGSLMMSQVVPAYTKSEWDEEPWIKCLKRSWVASDPFRNAKSGNLCVYLTKDLKQSHKVRGMERRAHA